MTNKTIIPFCVDAKAEKLSADQLEELHFWCLEAGAESYEGSDNWLSLYEYPLSQFFGIDEDKDTNSYATANYFNNNIILFKDVREHLGLEDVRAAGKRCDNKHIPNKTTLSAMTEVLGIDKNTLVKYANILDTDITVCQDGSYIFFSEMFKKDIVLKTDEDLEEFIDSYSKMMKFIK